MQKKNKYILVFLSLTLLNTVIAFIVFSSFKAQYFLLSEFNNNTYNLSLDYTDNLNDLFPSVTVTTIPIRSIKAMYQLKKGNNDKAIEYAKSSFKINPYLKFNEAVLAEAYLAKGIIDSALIYSKEAYYGIPNNDIHQDVYLRVLKEIGDIDEMRKVFLNHKSNKSEVIWYRYLSYVANTRKIEKSIDLELSNQAVDLFPNNKEFPIIRAIINEGIDIILEANRLSEIAQTYYSKKEFSSALEYFKQAEKILPNEYAYKENIATTLVQLKDYKNALKFYNICTDSLNPKTGKPEYLKGYLYLLLYKRDSACLSFSKSYKLKNKIGIQLYEQYCKN